MKRAPYPQFDGTQACHDTPATWWFPRGRGGAHDPDRVPLDAVLACRACPWATPCLAYALTHPDVDGVWAGTSEAQRHRLRQARRSTPPS